METLEVTSQKNFNDHDLLLVLHRDVQHIMESMKDLKENDIKEIKENSAARLQKLEDNCITKAEVDQILRSLATDADKLHEDHETRLRFIERYMWLAIGVVGVLQFLVTLLSNNGFKI